MTKLAHPVQAVTKVVVTKCVANTELLLGCHTNLQLMLSAGIGN